MTPRSSAEQWLALAAVVDHGGYAAAGEALHRSPSAVNYQVQRLQQALGLELLRLEGRRAVLTAHGEALLKRARPWLAELVALEQFAGSLTAGFEPELQLVVDLAFPQAQLLAALGELRASCPQTRIELTEAVLSGAEEAILLGMADLVVTSRVPAGFLGDWIYETHFVAVSSPQHPLQQLGHALEPADLARHVQVVLRDSGQRAPRDEGFLGADVRWTVGSLGAARAAVEAGLVYAWLPEHVLTESLAAGRLRILPLAVGSLRRVPLYLVLPKGSRSGPAARAAAEHLQRHALTGDP